METHTKSPLFYFVMGILAAAFLFGLATMLVPNWQKVALHREDVATGSFCGDGGCNRGETMHNCPADCMSANLGANVSAPQVQNFEAF
jgi:hypothetical protein